MNAKIHNLTVLSLAVTLNFETFTIFGITAFLSKISIIMIFIASILRSKNIILVRHLLGFYSISILFIFWVLWTNFKYAENAPFYLPINMLIDFALLLILISFKNFDSKMWSRMWRILLITIIFISFVFVTGLGVEERSPGRYSIMGINENMLGFIASIGLNLSIINLLKSRLNFQWKLFIASSLITMLYMLIATGSRGATIACFISNLFIIYHHTLSTKRVLPLLIFIVVSSFSIIILLLTNINIISRFRATFRAGDLSARDWIWLELLPLFNENVWTGIGVSKYIHLVGELSPHNVLLEVLIYCGVVGLFLFLVFLSKIAFGAIRSLKANHNITGIALLLNTSALILGGQIFDQRLVWLIFAFCVSESVKHHYYAKN